MKKVELLAPAGDQESLIAAIQNGADAIYLGGTLFNARAFAKNFDDEQLEWAIHYAHLRNVKIYVTVNTLYRDDEFAELIQYLDYLYHIQVDALIVQDIGLFHMIKKRYDDFEIHMSTQASIMNKAAAQYFYEQGASRIVLARENTLEEIQHICKSTSIEVEVFVHGALCVCYSGQCLMSSFIGKRSGNRGECAQPCRWGYHLMEEKRDGQYFPVFEDDKGTYILNSKDLCMINHIDKLAEAGVTSLKIEGRAKSAYYVAVITNAYRMAVDWHKKHFGEPLPDWISEEVFKVSHRKYCTGFFFGHPKDCQFYENGGYIRNYDVVAVIENCCGGFIYATQRNRFFLGDTLEIFSPGCKPVIVKPEKIFNEKHEEITSVNHAMMKFYFQCNHKFPKNSIIRKKVN